MRKTKTAALEQGFHPPCKAENTEFENPKKDACTGTSNPNQITVEVCCLSLASILLLAADARLCCSFCPKLKRPLMLTFLASDLGLKLTIEGMSAASSSPLSSRSCGLYRKVPMCEPPSAPTKVITELDIRSPRVSPEPLSPQRSAKDSLLLALTCSLLG
mmetsp:Transcript_9006/g.15117  ORF Transcript_9006/g.15117 Transcript_9006/m.15117 type:complete len:160 (-) Transcript_9006:968-1447(-)